MEVVRSLWGNKNYLVNSYGTQITLMYSHVSGCELGPFYVAVCSDFLTVKNKKPSRMYVFNIKTEEYFAEVTDFKKIGIGLYALRINAEWYFFDDNMKLLLRGVREIVESTEYPYIICRVKGKAYILNYNLKAVSLPFVAISEIDRFGNAFVITNLEDMDKRSLVALEYGKFILRPWAVECDSIHSLSKTVIRFWKNHLCGIIDSNGKEILPAIYRDIEYRKNYFILNYKGKFGLADSTGKIILECIYGEIIETQNKFVAKLYVSSGITKVIEFSIK